MEDPRMMTTGIIIPLEIQEGEFLLIGNVIVILEDIVIEEATKEVREEASVDLEALVDPVELVNLVNLIDLEDLVDLVNLKENPKILEISIQRIMTLDMEVPLALLALLVIKNMKTQITDGHQYLLTLLTTMECLGITEKLDGLHQTSISILGIYLVEKILEFCKVTMFKIVNPSLTLNYQAYSVARTGENRNYFSLNVPFIFKQNPGLIPMMWPRLLLLLRYQKMLL
jgi:hypothetical protein